MEEMSIEETKKKIKEILQMMTPGFKKEYGQAIETILKDRDRLDRKNKKLSKEAKTDDICISELTEETERQAEYIKEQNKKIEELSEENRQYRMLEGESLLGKAHKRIEELEKEVELRNKALSFQSIGMDIGAKLYSENQALINKLEKDIRELKEQQSKHTKAQEIYWDLQTKLDYAQEILNIVKGEKE